MRNRKGLSEGARFSTPCHRWPTAAALALAVAAVGCSSLPPTRLVHRSDDTPGVARPSYNRALDAATRYISHYEGLNQRFFLAATWESWPFRQQRVLATAGFLNLPEAEVQVAMERERAEAADWVDFFVGFYTADNSWNDLSSPTSIWRVEVQYPDGSTGTPTVLERVVRPNANLRALYPYLTPFWDAYRIRFPRGSLEKEGFLTLRLSSSVGTAEARWLVSPSSTPE